MAKAKRADGDPTRRPAVGDNRLRGLNMHLNQSDIPADLLERAAEAANRDRRSMVVGHHPRFGWVFRDEAEWSFIPGLVDVATVVPRWPVAA
ncbi:hypothetical protein JYK14_24575 [Siccirubricoccus sp. KC 17139]|uniref:Uncharacterized protein n=1 Tax=Siccirubricoccus soli TaxID=2899147 RepID=A0ABT1DBJ4_9PROT|nr:hypothetical protein [Siccirubricoccus soli]MCO6419311.1 hypothetical protein [Siccirubricoccus soli]MCP2685446.1 hypothetical protein [Siccirubricoccus soli]